MPPEVIRSEGVTVVVSDGPAEAREPEPAPIGVHAAAEVAAAQQRRIDGALAKQAAIEMPGEGARVQIGNFRVPRAWALTQARPGCGACDGTGENAHGAQGLCSCVGPRAMSMLVRAGMGAPKDVDPVAPVARAVSPAVRERYEKDAAELAAARERLAERERAHLGRTAADESEIVALATEMQNSTGDHQLAEARVESFKRLIEDLERELRITKEKLATGLELVAELAVAPARLTREIEAKKALVRVATKKFEENTAGIRAHIGRLERRIALGLAHHPELRAAEGSS